MSAFDSRIQIWTQKVERGVHFITSIGSNSTAGDVEHGAG